MLGTGLALCVVVLVAIADYVGAACGAAVWAAWAAWSVSGIVSRLARWLWTSAPSSAAVPAGALRIGLLGVANIAPYALLHPARQLSDSVRVTAVGARDPARAARLAAAWSIPHSGDYESVLRSREVDAVYVPLLNGLHYEWAIAALRAGKHVLVEKPITSNGAEAAALRDEAARRRRVLFEGFHWRYHPLAARVKAVLASGEIGAARELRVSAGLPSAASLLSAAAGALGLAGGARRPKMDAALGGGNFMGQGCYTVSAGRHPPHMDAPPPAS
jgi:predicted dehydrogenase